MNTYAMMQLKQETGYPSPKTHHNSVLFATNTKTTGQTTTWSKRSVVFDSGTERLIILLCAYIWDGQNKFGYQLDEPYSFPGDHQPDATMLKCTYW